MTYLVLQEATTAPFDVSDLKEHLFIDSNDTTEDTYLLEILLAAQQGVADYIGDFVTATIVRYDVSRFGRVINPPHRFIESITSVAYYNRDNELTTVDPTDYIVDSNSRGTVIRFVNNFTFPAVSQEFQLPVQITYVAGIAVVNDSIRQAIKILAGEMYQSRSETTSSNVQRLPLTLQRLLSNHRRH